MIFITKAWHSRGQRFDPAYLHQKLVRVKENLEIERFQGFFLSKSRKFAVFALCACAQVGFEVYPEIMAAKRTPASRKRKRCDSFIMSLAVFSKLQKS